MRSGDPLILLAAVIIGAIVIAFPLAIFINRITRWWKFRKIERAMATPTKRERRILPPHKSAARPSNVKSIARKPVHPKAKGSA